MSRYLKHFTVVGDDPVQWSNDYQKWEEEEEENGEKQPDSEIKLEPTRSRVSFQDMMKKLFSSHRFQVRQNKPGPKGNEGKTWAKGACDSKADVGWSTQRWAGSSAELVSARRLL